MSTDNCIKKASGQGEIPDRRCVLMHEPASHSMAGFGEIPRPTVQSGWKKYGAFSGTARM